MDPVYFQSQNEFRKWLVKNIPGYFEPDIPFQQSGTG